MTLILLVTAVLLLLLAAFGIGYRRCHFGWLGLAIALAVLAVWPAAHR